VIVLAVIVLLVLVAGYGALSLTPLLWLAVGLLIGLALVGNSGGWYGRRYW
jgi:hypothetical protein